MKPTMCRIVVIFSSFFIFAKVLEGSVPIQKPKEPFVLVEQVIEGDQEYPHYGVSVCAIEDKTNHEIVFLPSERKYSIIYACYPVNINECLEEYGNYRNDYCIFKHKPKCGVEGNYQYVIKHMLNENGERISCSRQENAEFYRVGYDFKFAKGYSADVDIYRFCYSEITQKTLYVEYKIISPYLLDTNVDHKTYYRSIDESYSDETVDLSNFGEKLKHYKNVKEHPEMYKSNVPTFLVPTEHMALDWWKAPLFNIANVQFLRREMHDNAYMKKINDFIRLKAKELLGEVFIRAGAFDLSKTTFESYVWWKLIYNEKQTHAIALIIHNGATPDDAEGKACNKAKKKLNYCKQMGWGGLVPTNNRFMMYCCDPDYIVNIFGFEKVETLNLIPEKNQELFKAKNLGCKNPRVIEPASENDSPSDNKKKFKGFISTWLMRKEG